MNLTALNYKVIANFLETLNLFDLCGELGHYYDDDVQIDINNNDVLCFKLKVDGCLTKHNYGFEDCIEYTSNIRYNLYNVYMSIGDTEVEESVAIDTNILSSYMSTGSNDVLHISQSQC